MHFQQRPPGFRVNITSLCHLYCLRRGCCYSGLVDGRPQRQGRFAPDVPRQKGFGLKSHRQISIAFLMLYCTDFAFRHQLPDFQDPPRSSDRFLVFRATVQWYLCGRAYVSRVPPIIRSKIGY